MSANRMHSANAVSMNTLQSIRGDLVHAMRALAKGRAFTLVCVVSLGIGMGAVVALATLGRAIAAQARGINTDGLVEVLVLPQGPLREKAGVWALERWSYPDYPFAWVRLTPGTVSPPISREHESICARLT